MNPKGTRKTHAQRLSPKEKRKIVTLSRANVGQGEIASLLGCCVDTIRRQQKKLCCAPRYRRPVDDEARREILELHGQGFGSRQIASRTKIGAQSVLKVLRDSGIKLICGGRPLPQEIQNAIDDDIRSRRDFLVKIAKKYGVGVETVRRRKRKILGPAPLLSVWPPLQSKFSQKDAARFLPATPEQAFLCLISGIIDTVAEEYLRQGRNREEVMAARQFLKSDPQPIIDKFDAGLREAVATLRESENARWTN